MSFKTFADELMMLGETFPADTVIIDATDICKLLEEVSPIPDRWDEMPPQNRPPFDNMFIQARIRVHPENQYHTFGWLFTFGGHNEWFVYAYHKAFYGQVYQVTPIYLIEWYTDNEDRWDVKDIYAKGLPPRNSQLTQLKLDQENPFVLTIRSALATRDGYQFRIGEKRRAFSIPIMAFSDMHQHAELELHTYSRQVERQVKRKTGKRPSPYFLLKVNPNTPRKVYESKNGTPTERHLREHIVRGHFRINPPDHPIPQFAGKTLWIPAHVRGDAEIGKVQKGYRIVLD